MAEAILARSGMVPQTRTINGLPLTDNIAINDTHISAWNGVVSGSLRNILSNCTIHRYGIQPNADIVSNSNYPYAYEAVVPNYVDIGLDRHWWHIKYFRHGNNDGYGAQLAISLDGGNKIYFRTSIGTGWQPWSVIYSSANLNPDTIGAAWANHTHDLAALGASRIILGTYTGQNESNYNNDYAAFTRFINIGVTARAIMILNNGCYMGYSDSYGYIEGGFATPQNPLTHAFKKDTNYATEYRDCLVVGTNGFTVREEFCRSGNWGTYIRLDTKNTLYQYIAFI